MTDAIEVAERLGRLEAQVSDIRYTTKKQDEQIEKLESDLIAGMRAQETLLREVVHELKEQHASLKTSYDRMNAFSKGVLWLGGIVSATVVVLSKFNVREFFS